MNKTRVFLLLTTLVIILASSMTALAQTPTVAIGSPTGGSTVDTNLLVDVSGSYTNAPVGATVLVQLFSSVPLDSRSLALDGSGNWFANDIDLSTVPKGTSGYIIAYLVASDLSTLATSSTVSVTWGFPVPTAEPTFTPSPTATFTPTSTATEIFTATPTATGTQVGTATTTPTPTMTKTPSLTPPPAATITILSPLNESIFPTGVVVSVVGTSTNLLANGLTVRALNANSDVLAEASVIPDVSGNWIANLTVNVPLGTRGKIYVFAPRPGDGFVYASARVTVTYGGPCVVRTDWFVYTVQAGDTLFRIANRVGSNINELALANCLDNTNLIYVGQPLRVPRQPAAPPTPNPTTNLRILTPLPNGTVDTSDRVNVAGTGKGIAGYSIVVRALNQAGEVLGQQVAVASAANAAGDSSWQTALFISVPPGTPGSIYAYAVSPANGAIVADELIQVTYGGASSVEPTPRPTGEAIEGAIEVIINTPVDNQTFVLANPVVNGRVVGLTDGTLVLRALDAESNVLGEASGSLTPISESESSWQFALPFDVPTGTRATIYAYVTDPLTGVVAGADAVNVVVGESNANPFVTIIDPLPYAIVPLDEPVTITGYGARLFEGTVLVRLLDDQGGVLAEAVTTVDSPNAGTGGEGQWQLTLDVNAAAGTRGSIYAFATSAQDGSVITAARRYVTFGDPSDATNFVQITTPLPGTLISADNALLIAGRADLNSGEAVTVQVFDEVGNILIEEPRPINPVDGAAYGTWDVILELQNLQPGTRLRVNAFTTSSFDGSILSSDSVQLTYAEAGGG